MEVVLYRLNRSMGLVEWIVMFPLIRGTITAVRQKIRLSHCPISLNHLSLARCNPNSMVPQAGCGHRRRLEDIAQIDNHVAGHASAY